ncbi:MAG: hypothetical protein HQ518_03900 [Rhodopirellula sp.]|nr:hypothetical protein [Rhodopirellula sp.]
MVRTVHGVMLIGLVSVMGCVQDATDPTPGKVTSEDVRRDAEQAAHTAAEFSEQTKEEFQKKFEARLKELDAEIARLREKGHDLKGEARANREQKMADLETKRDAAHARLAEVSQSSAEAWKDAQKGAQSAWDVLDKAFHDAAREF